MFVYRETVEREGRIQAITVSGRSIAVESNCARWQTDEYVNSIEQFDSNNSSAVRRKTSARRNNYVTWRKQYKLFQKISNLLDYTRKF